MLVKPLEALSVPATLTALGGTIADATTHRILTGKAILENRIVLAGSSLVGKILAEHSGNITKSVGPAIAVVWVAEQIRSYAEGINSEKLVKFANGFEFAGLLAICGANIIVESFKKGQFFLLENDQFVGDVATGIGFMLIGVIATKGTILLCKNYDRKLTSDIVAN